MRKKTLAIAAIVVVSTIAAVVSYLVLTSRQLSPPGTATYSYNGVNIQVSYFRPSKRGRLIFGDENDGALQPNGKYWRLGANDATEITFSKDVTFAGNPLTAGTYRMYAILDESFWTIALNSELGEWGASEPDISKDILRVDVPVEKTPSVTEQFTITFDEDAAVVNMHFAWDTRHLKIPIAVPQ